MIWSAFLLDLLLGDPRWLPHPIRGIGLAITRLESRIRSYAHEARALMLGGCLLTLCIVAGTFLASWLVLSLFYWMDRWLGVFVAVYLAYTAIAVRDLYKQSWAVIKALRSDDLEGARFLLSRVVGRDTEELEPEEIIRAVIETVAENFSDGVAAPLFYMALAGVPGAMAYKAASTLDSMVGYRNERYAHLGWCSARLDDVLNFIPARLSALLIVAAAFLLRLDARNAWRIFLRDGGNHKSPNSGRPEAAMAGALGVQLGGPSRYEGIIVEKPRIGDPLEEFSIPRVLEAEQVMFIASVLMVTLTSLIRI